MTKFIDKINNSYETDPSLSSNGSSSDSVVNPETETIDYRKLKKLLGMDPSSQINNHTSKMECNKINTSSLARRSSNANVEFKSCFENIKSTSSLPSLTDPNIDPNCIVSLKKLQVTPLKLRRIPESPMSCPKLQFSGEIEKKFEMSSVQTFGSEEISDQDISCKAEMEKMADNLHHIKGNTELLNISEFSIEPSSVPSENESDKPNKKVSNDIFILSMSENSSNAVDNYIAVNKFSADNNVVTDLSFNGKIGNGPNTTESMISKSTETSVKNETKQDINNKTVDKPIVNLEVFKCDRTQEDINERSPDIFKEYDEEYDNTDTNQDQLSLSLVNDSLLQNPVKDEGISVPIEKREKRIIRQLQNLLSGILPPPSVTIIQHDIHKILTLYKTNEALMNSEPSNLTSACNAPSLSLTCDEEAKKTDFEEALTIKNFGVHYNQTQFSDRIEIMYMKLAERHIGHETASSFTYFWPSSCNKKIIKKTFLQSPGNRLSHLARRRAIFSSANLQSNMNLGNSSKLGSKPCVIDASKLMRKEKVRTPKRRTPGRRKIFGSLTPSSSKKKFGSATKANMHFLPKPVTATRETSKRALFQSPAQEKPKLNFTPDVAVRVERSKRALFSPPKRFERSISTSSQGGYSQISNERSAFLNRTVSDVSISAKRRRDNDEENLTPRVTKIAKSQSSFIGSTIDFHNNTVARSFSENSVCQQQLSNSHKQKLLWAVSTALNKKTITSAHENFRKFAFVLTKVVKRLYMESLGDSDKLGGTSATMLRLADKLVFWVIQGKSVDEIYLTEKMRIENSKNPTKITGYVGPEEYETRKNLIRKSSSNLLSENSFSSMDSFCLSQGTISSQLANSMDGNLNQIENVSENFTNNSLVNSSSKNNLSSNILRENHDAKSAQKNPGFSGKDQKNVSPYSDKMRPATSNKQNKLLIGGAINSSLLKVKRQISFDT